MARIVLASFGTFGDVNPYVGLALALRARGHEPVLALPAMYRGAAAREDLAFRSVRPDVDIHDRAFAARIMDPARGTDVTFGEILIPSLAETTADLKAAVAGADLLVTHPTSLAGPIVAEEERIPWASTVLSPSSLFSRYDPMVPAPAPWMHLITSRSRLAARLFRWLTERLTKKWAEPVLRFRKSRGLPPGGNPITDGQHSPYLVLGLFSRVLADPQPDWPERVLVAGASFYNGRGDPELPEALDTFVDAGTPPLVFTLGSSAVGAAGSFYEVSTEVALSLGRRAVLLAGRHAENRPSVSHPDIFVADFARHDALFPRAAAIIHQGGAGTLHQGMRAGVPMLVVPHAHDQPDNAYRVERLGVACSLTPSQYRVHRVQRHLATLLDDPAYRERARAVADLVEAEPGAEGAAQAIEDLLGRVGH